MVLIQDQGRTLGVRVAHPPEWAKNTPGSQHRDVSKRKSAFWGRKQAPVQGKRKGATAPLRVPLALTSKTMRTVKGKAAPGGESALIKPAKQARNKRPGNLRSWATAIRRLELQAGMVC